ncbi:MAG: hypothetical protein VZR13_04810 [Saccharofermentanaceae bacterium]|nr:hypothetical protein [Saccharofermentanaceae bacterium]
MKNIKRLLSFLFVIVVVASFSLPANAGASDVQFTGTLYVNQNGSQFSTVFSTTTATRQKCYIRLYAFQFPNWPENTVPTNYLVNARLYTVPAGSSDPQQASVLAQFSAASPEGQKNISYKSGYGGNGQSYKLKTNSTYGGSGYSASFFFSANPYVL